MKKSKSLIVLISFTYCVATTAADTIPASDPLIEYTGRIDFSVPDAPRFSYSGVSVRACFTGTGISMIMDDNTGQNYYNLILDGNVLDTVRISTGVKTYVIANVLEDTVHEIEIFRRTEEMFGKTRFLGFIVDEGATLTPIVSEREKFIEYIGNSITCGYGNEGVNGGTFGPTTENHYMTYAALTSRNFNARHMAVSKSGIGIYRNYDGPASGNADCMTNFYTRVFLYDATPEYSFSEKPDLVCINLGTNDFSTSGADSALFVSNYLRLIDTIQTKYSMPDILCLLGPMISDPDLSTIRDYITFVADSASRKGMGTVNFFEMSRQTGSLGIAIDYHPTVAQHIKNGLELTDYIKTLKGWKITPLVIDASLDETTHIQVTFNTPLLDTVNDFSGFTVYGNDQEYDIGSIYQDTTDANILHIGLQEEMQIGEKVNLSYTPGTVVSRDSVEVSGISYLKVQNKLSETLVTKGATTSDGTRVLLTCNKNIKKNSGIEGLILTDENFVILEIDSFTINNTQITLFIRNVISLGESLYADYSGTGIIGVDGIPLSGFENYGIENKSVINGILNTPAGSFILYPNPNLSGIFQYRLDDTMHSKELLSYAIVTVSGKLVLQGYLSGNEGQLDLRGKVSAGTYYLQLRSGDIILTKQIVLNN
jgi:hypothetical protein